MKDYVDEFIRDCNEETYLLNIPETVENLRFGYSFNQPVNKLPTSLTYLTFGYNFNQSVKRLPLLLEEIEFGHLFNQPVDMLPQSIQKLIFGYSFNHSVDNLPLSIQNLIIGYCFNKPVNKIPKSLLFLRVSSSFNQYVETFPPGLSGLIIGGNFLDYFNIETRMLNDNQEKGNYVNKNLFKSLYNSNIPNIFINQKNIAFYKCCKEKTIKNENISFSKYIINIDMLYKKIKIWEYDCYGFDKL